MRYARLVGHFPSFVALALVAAIAAVPSVARARAEDEAEEGRSEPEEKPEPAPKEDEDAPEPPPPPRAPIVGLSPPRDEPYIARETSIAPTLTWLLTQVVPSPEVLIGSEGARFGMRWQVTPLLYSFGIHRRLSPWRTLVVEPIVRHSGSLELFVSPEWVADHGGSMWLDVGVRSTIPLLHRGEYLSASLGVAHTAFQGQSAVRYEAGAYVVFGVVGVVVSVSPTPSLAPLSTALTLRLRYF